MNCCRISGRRRMPTYLTTSLTPPTTHLSLLHLLTFASVIGTQFQALFTTTEAMPTTTTTRTTPSTTAIAAAASATIANFHFDAYNNYDYNNNNITTNTNDIGAILSTMKSSSFPSAAVLATTSTITHDTSHQSFQQQQLLQQQIQNGYKMPSSSLVMSDDSSRSIFGVTTNNANNNNNNSPSVTSSSSSSSSSSSLLSLGPSDTTAASVPHENSKVTSSNSIGTARTNNNNNNNKFPLDFTFSRNHWTNSDAVSFVGGGEGGAEMGDRPRTFRNKHHHERHWGPFFEEPLNSTAAGDNLISTAHLYTEAALNCRVGMLKDKTVMWIRRMTEKVSLLTVGNVTYSGDPRIRVKFQYPNNWRLLINPARRDDAGVYMCQVSTHPPRVFTTNLTILEPPLRLIDEQEREVGDRYYKSGSTIDLQCQVSRSFLLKEKLNILKSLQLPTSTASAASNTVAQQNQTKLLGTLKNSATTMDKQFMSGQNELQSGANQTGKQSQSPEKQFGNYIFWAKDDEPLPASAIKRPSTTDKWLSIRVTISDAKLTDSGNYSCAIGKLFTAIVQVQVLTGEMPAAVQHNAAATLRSLTTVALIIITTTIISISAIWQHLIAVVCVAIARSISPSISYNRNQTVELCGRHCKKGERVRRVTDLAFKLLFNHT